MQNKPSKAAFQIAALVVATMALFIHLASFKAKTGIDELWSRLGISQDKATGNIKESFLRGYFYYYGANAAKKIASGDRAAVATDLLTYTKSFVNSEAFIAQYNKEREAAKPAPFVAKAPKTKEELRAEKIAETEKAIKETETNIKKLSPEIAKSVEPVLEMFKKNLVEYKKPNSEMIELFYSSEIMGEESRQREAEQRLERWMKDYPTDYRQMIKTRLQTFLDLAETVDFSAQLKEQGGKLRFVNPHYEAKPSDWKLIFRAGKEVSQPSVAFAKAWIGEIEKGK
ncbi:MAG: hypothetical protein JWP88_1917 [Flaviaesturariibacter sp.]|nr:hypothetical protein [Flaviaesturariibacter sp.]